MGFFAKQMVLSAAINSGYIFITFIAIITSVIGGVYYLNLIKEIIFKDSKYKNLPFIVYLGYYYKSINNNDHNLTNKKNYIYTSLKIPSPISFIISVITLIILLFIFVNKEWLSISTILVQILYNY
jgi:NADH-ubiquinone oxidoreductase chain 2